MSTQPLFNEDAAYYRNMGGKRSSTITEECENIQNELSEQKTDAGVSLLDIGSGLGEHAKRFETNGYDVVCLELNDGMVNELRGEGLCVAQSSMANIPFEEETFDIVTMFSSPLAYITDESEFSQVLEEIHRVLSPDGKIFLEYDPEKPLRVTPTEDEGVKATFAGLKEPPLPPLGGVELIERNQDQVERIIEYIVTIEENDERRLEHKRHQSKLALRDTDSVKQQLTEAGFQDVTVDEDITTQPNFTGTR